MDLSPLPPPVWIATPAALRRMALELEGEPRLALDTESNSLHAYRERVCLVQISTSRRDYLVDPFALPDLSPLAPILSNHLQEKVLHAAEYDVICLRRDFGFNLVNTFDTMQAARILGYPAVGLEAMLAEKFQVHLDKRFQKADWGRRPLGREQLEYAGMDSHFLLDLRDALQPELVEKGRWQLAQEEFSRLERSENHADTGPSWLRVSGVQKLRPPETAILRELCRWRERLAERLDRPVFKVIGDDKLTALAVGAPQALADLEPAGLTLRQVQLYGSDLLRAIRRGQESPPLVQPKTRRQPAAQVLRLDALRAWRKKAAAEMGVESDLVLPRPFMQAIAEQAPHDIAALAACMPDSPWRLARYGEEILKAIKVK
ncbi:MAG: hypothetical protein FJZ96_02610 [Chloroflexi bacterium]|nr:hypothetical protein [Chloroflexota bacterium]